jgi:hypothetical protein
MKRYAKLIIEKTKKIKDAVMFPQGVDEKFDKECESSFHRFLDRLYYFSFVAFAIFSCFVVYFFVSYKIL